MRLWLFRAVAFIVVPLLFLLAVEGGLRLVGVGYPAGFTVECAAQARPSRCDNPKFGWRFFPRKIARAAESFAFPTSKPERTVRVFLVGASAAQGDPEPTYGVARILSLLLTERYPGVRFEVVNTAVTAINSHVVLPIVRDLARRDADLFVVYLGNNEVVGPFGAGTVFSPLRSRLPLVRWNVRLGATRIGQTMERLTGAGSDEALAEWGGMKMFLGHRVAAGDPRLARVREHFRRNLDAIVEQAIDSGAKVLLSTVATNLADSAPFASLHRQGLTAAELDEFERLMAAAELATAGEAREALLAAAEIDPQYAELHYRLGRLYREAGEADAARGHFESALELDALRFRADRHINEVVREVGATHAGASLRLVDAERRISSASVDGIPGEEFFHEHVHFSFAGNYLLALLLLEQSGGLLPEWVESNVDEGPPLSERECAARLAYSDFDRRRVLTAVRDRLTQPPFSQQSDTQERLGRLDEQIRELERKLAAVGAEESGELYAGAIQRRPDDPWLRRNYAQLLTSLGDQDAAIEELRAFLSLLPQDPGGREQLAAAFAAQGRFEEAIAQCRELIERLPTFSKPYYTMAYALAKLGRLDESITLYRELLRIDPGSTVEIYNEIGRIQIHDQDEAAAVDTYRAAVAHNRSHAGEPIPDLHYNLGFALKRLDRRDEAVASFRRAAESYAEVFEESPGSIAPLLAAGNAWIECAEYERAAEAFRQAIRIDAANPDARRGLERALELAGT